MTRKIDVDKRDKKLSGLIKSSTVKLRRLYMVDVWNKDIETLSKDDAEALRLNNLKKQLKYI